MGKKDRSLEFPRKIGSTLVSQAEVADSKDLGIAIYVEEIRVLLRGFKGF
jgi:hypothetical protein